MKDWCFFFPQSLVFPTYSPHRHGLATNQHHPVKRDCFLLNAFVKAGALCV